MNTKCYNLYMAAGGAITYGELTTKTIGSLGLNNNDQLMFAVEAEMKF